MFSNITCNEIDMRMSSDFILFDRLKSNGCHWKANSGNPPSLPDLGWTHLLLWETGSMVLTGVGTGPLFFLGGRPGPFFLATATSTFTSSFSATSPSESSENESPELPDITVGETKPS